MVKVSVCITCYNHEAYIGQCIDSILAQETNFEYEILVHDDCSTDGSRAIIEGKVLAYPNIIKPIFQSSNKYSLGEKVNFRYNFPRAVGDFIALCEGDDYWVDCLKLQKQHDILNQDKFLKICFGRAKIFDEKSKNFNGFLPRDNYVDSQKFVCLDFINAGITIMPTCTIMFRKEILDIVPAWFETSPVSDFFLQIFSTLDGYALYFDQTFSVYRRFTRTSWSLGNLDSEQFFIYCVRMLDSFHCLANEDAFKMYKPQLDALFFKRSMVFLRSPNLSLTSRYGLVKKILFRDISLSFFQLAILIFNSLLGCVRRIV